MVKKEMIAMLLAGGQGSRLGVLTQRVAKPAVAFGGKYCIDLSIAAARILGIIRLGFAEVEITEYEETIVPLKAGPIKVPGIEFGTVNLGYDYTPEWKIDSLPPLKPLH